MISQKWLLIIVAGAIVIYFIYNRSNNTNGFNGNVNNGSDTNTDYAPNKYPMYYTYPLGTDPNAVLEIYKKQCAQNNENGIPMNELVQRYNSETFLHNDQCQPGIDNVLAKGIVTRVPPTGGSAINGGFGGMRGGPVDYNDTIVI